MAKPPPPLAFREAVRWFRERVPLTRAEAEELELRTGERAFYVSGVAQLRLVGELHRAITQALKKGTTLEDFKRAASAKLESEWGGEIPGRIETIFRTNVQSAYNAGRLETFDQPLMRRLRPYRAWSVILDRRTTEAICRPLAKVVVEADSAFARSRIPPLHFSCRTGLMSLSAEQAAEEGITTELPKAPPADGFGGDPRTPKQVDISDEPKPLVKQFKRKMAKEPQQPEVPEEHLWPQGRVRGDLAADVERKFPEVAQALGKSLRVDAGDRPSRQLRALQEVEVLGKIPTDVLKAIGKGTNTHVGVVPLSELGTGTLTPKKTNPAMADARDSWDQVGGVFFRREAPSNPFHAPAPRPPSEVLVNVERSVNRGVLAHEFGHALDLEVLRGASATPAFKHAYEAFKASSVPNAQVPYFVGDPATGPSETFAEAFNDLVRKGADAAAQLWTREIVTEIQSAMDRVKP